MQQPIDLSARALDERLAAITEQLGALVVEHGRLLTQRRQAVGDTEAQPPGYHPDPDEPTDPPADQPALWQDATARRDRIVYVTTMRASMLRALYTMDAALVRDRFDRVMLRGARQTLLEGIDAADATLLLDHAADFQPDDEDDGD